ncbi:hypothetical protein [Mesobaculum littorinae]|uniref:hypothetical protein n=1 Tax=Mesobaculum littorinae TaxID=2486419 RepID=UPI0013E3F860|nr:hypothetical protein [Mesobaculum littorinae]
MIVFVCAVIGAIWGAVLARRRQGRALDMAQYAAGCAILGALIGLFATIAVHRVLI